MPTSSSVVPYRVFAALFALLALSNFLKPLQLTPDAGFVFLGARTSGAANAVLGPLFGAYLAAYAWALFGKRRIALPLGWAYAGYVAANLTLWNLRQPIPDDPGYRLFGLAYVAVAIGVSWGAALFLTRRRAELA